MNRLLRNSEVYRSLLISLIISAIGIIAAFILDRRFGVLTVILCAGLLSVQFFTIYFRYRRLSKLAYDIDRILHGDSHISLEGYSEGELELLRSEIYKMTVRIREQQERLMNDKLFLADTLADISHQIRTPLTSINLIVTMLMSGELSDSRKSELLRKLHSLLSRIDWLVNTLLKMSRLDAGTVVFKKETLSFTELVQRAYMPVSVSMELRSQQLVTSCEGDFCGDIAWTVEALGNIVKNCMEHTPDGGRIEISAFENPLYAQISVSDNGGGISGADLPHIFERFYKGTESEDKGGFGIGLALARMIITGQNGTIKAENTSDGARFEIRFYKSTI